jgi:hypothetical protein
VCAVVPGCHHGYRGRDAPPELAFSAPVVGAGYAAATLVAYVLSPTVGLLGFEDGQTSPEAVIASAAEVVTLCSLGSCPTTSTQFAARTMSACASYRSSNRK